MTATARKLIRRTKTAVRQAVQISWDTCYALLNGHLNGLIRTGDMLDRLGIELKDGQQSWYGKHVAKAYRAQHGTDAPKAWVRHRTSGRWIHVYVYAPADPALMTGLRTYKATAAFAITRNDFAEAA